MRRGSKIALLAVGGSALLLFAAAAAFLIGHDVGTTERLAANRGSPAREQSASDSANMTKSAFQSWSLVCRTQAVDRRCVLFLAVADATAKQVLLTLSIVRTPKGMPALVIDTPAGALVDQGITLTAGAAEPFKVPFQSCGAQRCRAVTELTSSFQATLEAATVTSVTYAKADNQQSTYNLPTRGFKDGLAAWLAGSESSANPVSAVVN